MCYLCTGTSGITFQGDVWTDCYHSSTLKSCSDITKKATFTARTVTGDTTIANTEFFDNISNSCRLKGCILRQNDGITQYPNSGDKTGATVTDDGILAIVKDGWMPLGEQINLYIACQNSKTSPLIGITVPCPIERKMETYTHAATLTADYNHAPSEMFNGISETCVLTGCVLKV